jgi:DNA polymerase-1
MPNLYLIDGSGFIFRAYYALPKLNRADGTPINAVLGFCNMLQRLQQELNASHAAIIFDAARKTFRNEIYADYKAHRPPPPDDLIPQFSLVKEAARAFGFPSIESAGFEADDLIASYAREAREKGWDVTIISSDKDLMQLIRDGVAMQDPLKNKPIGPAEVLEKFGVPPEKVIDVQALTGDSTDNIPGAPGIGPKTGAKLIIEFGDLETLLARAGEVKQEKTRATLINFADQIRISKKLVTLDDHVPLPEAVDKLLVDADHAEKKRAFLTTQGFRTLLARMGEGAAAPAKTETPQEKSLIPAQAGIQNQGHNMDPGLRRDEAEEGGDAHSALIQAKQDYVCIQDAIELKRWMDAAKAQGFIALDTETDSLTPSTATLVGVSLALAPGRACYIPLNHVDPKNTVKPGELMLADSHRPKQLAIGKAIELLKPILEDPSVLKIGHNLKFDNQVLAQHGITVSPVEDTMLLSFVLAAGKHGHGLDELTELHLQHKMISYNEVTGTGVKRISFAAVPLDKATDYAAEDADFTLRLYHVLKPQLGQEKLINLYERIERPIIATVATMERIGVKIDANVLRELSQGFTQRLAKLEETITKEAGVSFNIASPKQLGEVLFDKMGLPGGKKSKTGAYSTSSDVLEPLAEQGHSIVQRILDWRGLAKLKSTYTDSLPQQIDARTGRVHTSFSLVGAATGRLSSTDPNLQNIPIRTEDGRAIRRAFVAEEGFTLLSVDYSQIELRLAADMANVAALKEAFRQGHDIHATTAAEVFGIPFAHVTPEQRRQAKAINFGIIYGISGYGLAKQISCTPSEASAFIRAYLDRFSELRAFMEQQKEKARAHGYVTTLFGRRCYIRGIGEKNAAMRNFAERQAINAPLQGTAADIMKRAMNRMPETLASEKLRARMILQVHDELLFEVPQNEKEETAATVRRVMEGAANLSVPLVADAGFGPNWAEAH